MAPGPKRSDEVDPEDVRRFVERGRALSGASSRNHWARRFREEGYMAIVRAGHALFEHASRVRAPFPTAAERESDLAHHRELKAMIDRCAHAFTDRPGA